MMKKTGFICRRKRFRGLLIATIALVFVLCGCAAGGGVHELLSLNETPQRYVLTGDLLETMPDVTLYESGAARLSQPAVSSLGLFGIGSYQIKDGTLTVSQQGAEVVFEISDGGDTLTIQSSTLQFTKTGAVYKYRSSADYASRYEKVEGLPLTLDVLRELAKKPEDIRLSDFEGFERVVIDPDYYLLCIGGEYSVRAVLDAAGGTSCTVERLRDGGMFSLTLNHSTGYVFEAFLGETVIPEYTPKKWIDYFGSDSIPWDERREITLPEFPDVIFVWTPEMVLANGQAFFGGMPVWNVFFADLTNDGKPEFCATVSMGSGITDTHIIVYDYAEGRSYQLSDRMYYDYYLSLQDGKLMVTQTKYADGNPLRVPSQSSLAVSVLWLENGTSVHRFGEVIPTEKAPPETLYIND